MNCIRQTFPAFTGIDLISFCDVTVLKARKFHVPFFKFRGNCSWKLDVLNYAECIKFALVLGCLIGFVFFLFSSRNKSRMILKKCVIEMRDYK